MKQYSSTLAPKEGPRKQRHLARSRDLFLVFQLTLCLSFCWGSAAAWGSPHGRMNIAEKSHSAK